MFNSDFYPTPKHLIERMLKPWKNEWGYAFKDKIILEPSAGKGDILDFLTGKDLEPNQRRSHTRADRVYCIEQDPELQATLQGKGYRLIHSDFLSYEGDYAFDIILMNPPFSNGDDHLLKAWNILESGDIVCLLNAETIRNPYTKVRALLKRIIEEHGSVEFIQNAFSQAERKTNVETALVRLTKKPTQDRFTFFHGTHNENGPQLDENTLGNPLARQNAIDNLVTYYEQSKKAFITYLKARERLFFYAKPLMPSEYKTVGKAIDEALKHDSKNLQYNSFVDDLKSLAWSNVFTKTKLAEVITSKVRRDFDEYAKHQGHMDFTRDNIFQLFDTLILNRNDIMQRCLVETFERMCSYDAKNKIHWEGWKTNDAYKVNRKVIMPHYIVHDGYFRMSYYKDYSGLDDVDKVMCLITSDRLEKIVTIRQALQAKFDELRKGKYVVTDNTVDSHFFEVRFFKKGTLHITFKDKFVWEQFNIMAAKGKNWLPE